MLDLLPHLRPGLGAGLGLSSGNENHRNPYLGVVFGYSGATRQAVVANLNNRISLNNDRELLPNFVFVAEEGYMVLRCKADGSPANLGGEFSIYVHADLGPDTLPLLFLTMNVCLGGLRLRRPDMNQLWWQVMAEAQMQSASRVDTIHQDQGGDS